MSFTKKTTEQLENNSTTNTGLTGTIANYLPILMLAFEQMTGQTIPQAKGTLADILTLLQKLETKFDNLERNCAEQFTHQETQLTSLQQISRLVSTEKTKELHFANKAITEVDQ